MRVGCIGAGHIARALGQGWSRPALEGAPALAYHDVSPEAAERAAEATGAAVAGDLRDLVERSDVVVVAVRPQQVAEVLAAVAPLLGRRALVSVAAGVPLAELRAALPHDARVGRIMPNVAASLGLGTFLFVPGTLGEAEGEVERLFALAGDVVVLDERHFDSATAVAGCMPGILALLVRDFARAGERRGLDPDVARRLAIAGVHGAAAVIAKDGDPDAVIAATATPGGMTAAAITALEERDITEAVALAVHAAAERAKELT
ncbi:MAG: NAD(P)-binding domain-containing protein [Actinobacteria bacterium]|nr:NAD(P)-binding domain-containing protein [Actinomycetota bacterium]